MTRLFLAAGVAALAIAMPASAKPGGGHGGGNQQAASGQVRGGGGGHGGGSFQAQGGGGGGGHAFRMESRGGGGGGHAFRMENRGGGGGGQAFRMQRSGGGQAFQQRSVQRQGHAQRQSFAFQERGHGRGNATVRAERGNQPRGFDRQRQVRSVERQHGNRFEQRQVRNVERMNGKRFDQREARNLERQRGFDRIQNREVFRNDFRGDRLARVRDFGGKVQGYGVGGCPPGLMSKGCMPPGQALKADRMASEAFRESRLAALAFDPRTRFIDPYQATRYIGAPLSTINGLMAFPSGYSYLYPDTPDYYYRYGNGYLYEVDRDTSLISALLPLLGGGILPGQYLPNSYMSSYVPDYYGFNSFYPASYAGYGYGYDNLCNRYANGVVYQVDCGTGFVEDVVPLYAGGYGVGQMLPAGYGYYNVPTQYRSLYYDTPDYNYWYAPGAIYQYDPSSSLITSVAALLSPGFNVGQPLPMGYDVYNVPYAYRSTYYDTPNAWYRYNNGYIYQVDPTTQLVTAIVASILT